MPPKLSLVVISYNMNRELPRTLFSLSAGYQRDMEAKDYEVLVVDNGSVAPPEAEQFQHLDLHLRILQNPQPKVSPAEAINLGLKEARGQWIGVFIDGARMASPGLLSSALQGLQLEDRAIVGSRGRYLGWGLQALTQQFGYDKDAEDKLLAKCRWQEDGYCLFSISVFDESSKATWFDPVAESNSLFMSRDLWEELGGFEPRFSLAGGGLVNLDIWLRALSLPNIQPMLLLGEATFHQVHGGTATNHEDPIGHWPRLCEEYEAIRGKPYQVSDFPLTFRGSFRHSPPGHEFTGGWRSPAVRQSFYLHLLHLSRKTLGFLKRKNQPRSQL